MASLTMAILWIASFGVFMGYLFHRTDGSVIPTMLAHLSLNVVLAVGGAPLSSPLLWWTTGTIFAATAAALFAWSVQLKREAQLIGQSTT
jgi:membrane protease YdiL (CAAX protease family)